MPYELPSWLGAAGTLVLIVGLFAGLALGVAVAAGRLAQRRWPTLLVAITAALGAGYLIAVAASRDDYYGNPTTRWDYAARTAASLWSTRRSPSPCWRW
jgi:hypothetical protein